MMRKTAVIALLAVTSVYGSQKWINEPDGFKGATFGMTQKEVIAATGIQHPCADADSCNLWIKVGDFTLKSTLLFTKGKFTQVIATFPPDSYKDMVEACIAKYGPPHHNESSQVQNRAGASFAQERVGWSGAHYAVLLSKYSTSLDEGSFYHADRGN